MEKAPNLEEALLSKLRELKIVAYEKDMSGTDKKVRDKFNELQRNYPDFYQYKTFHLLMNSTPPESATETDFPGEDSVEKFLRSL